MFFYETGDTMTEYLSDRWHTMAITYMCRYCNSLLGQIDNEEITEMKLGFHQLTPNERQDIISYDAKGHTLVRVVCESCQEMLEKNPELLLLPHPFQ